MPKQPESELYFIPFKPARGTFHKHRAFGMGVANVLAALLSADGFPVTTMSFSPPDADDPVKPLLEGEGAERAWTAVGGYYHAKNVFPLRLVVVPPAAKSVADEREFTAADEDDLEGPVREVKDWLREFGTGERQSGFRGPLARTLEQFIVDARQNAMLWLAHEVPSVVNKEFLDTLKEGMEFFRERIRDPYAGRRLRELALELAPIMSAKRQPEGDDPVSGVLKKMSRQRDPAGMEYIWPVLDEGVKRGADKAAFRACRGYVLYVLDRSGEALRDFEALEKAGPTPHVLFGKGRVCLALGRREEAAEAFNAALKLTKPGEPFTDIVLGEDAEPEPDNRTWHGMLLAARAQAERLDGKFEQGEQTARQAVEEGAGTDALGALAHVYLDWAIKLMEENKQEEARRLLRKHLEVLERIYEINPRFDEIEAGLSVSKKLGDTALHERWQERERELSKRHGFTDS